MQTYLDYLAWCEQAGIPSRMVLTEQEWIRQTQDLYRPNVEGTTNEKP